MSDPAQQALAESGTSGGTSPAGALESRGHEASAISLRAIVKFLIWFIAVAAVVHLIVWGLFVMQRGHERARRIAVGERPGGVGSAQEFQAFLRQGLQLHRLPPARHRRSLLQRECTARMPVLQARQFDGQVLREGAWIHPATALHVELVR